MNQSKAMSGRAINTTIPRAEGTRRRRSNEQQDFFRRRFKAAANRPTAWSVLRGNMGQCCCHKFPLLNHPFGNFSYLFWISHSYERAEPGGPRKLGGFGQYPTCLPRVFRTPIFGAIRNGDQWMRGSPTWEEVMVWRRQGSEC